MGGASPRRLSRQAFDRSPPGRRARGPAETSSDRDANARARFEATPRGLPLSQFVDPTVDQAALTSEDFRVAETLCKQRGALDAGEQAEREVARVAASELPELLFRPVDDRP